MKLIFQHLLKFAEVTVYTPSRLAIALGVGLLGYCTLVLSIVAWPWSGVVFAYLAYKYARRHSRLTTLGSARLADAADLRAAGMLNAQRGLIIGRLKVNNRFLSRLSVLFSPRAGSKQACLEFCSLAGTHLVRLSRAVHTVIVSPTGGGKGICCLIPLLFSSNEAAVTIDPKGEAARITAAHRAKIFGRRAIFLDPFCIVTSAPDCFNPLARIDKDSSDALDQCFGLAAALVVRLPDEREPHWSDSAQTFIAGVIAVVVYYGDEAEGTRSLQTVRDILSDPQKLDLAIRTMRESDAWGGTLARIGGQLSHYVEKERASVLTTALRHLRFLDSPAVVASTKSSSFDPAELLTGRIDIYCILPPDHMSSQSSLLRMWIGSFLTAVTRGGLQERTLVNFILDEAASLNRMEIIDDAADKLRGFGVRLTLFYQNLGQLKKCFPHDDGQTILGNATQVFFGANDPTTCEYISTRLGEATILLNSGGTSRTRQFSMSHNGQESSSYSTNFSHNWQQQARKLLKPEEVAALPPHTAITFAPGVPPIMTALLRYYEEPNLGQSKLGLVSFGQLVAVALAAIGTIVFSAGLALALTVTLAEKSQRPLPVSKSPHRSTKAIYSRRVMRPAPPSPYRQRRR